VAFERFADPITVIAPCDEFFVVGEIGNLVFVEGGSCTSVTVTCAPCPVVEASYTLVDASLTCLAT
jgi:hypothetical protein